MSDPSEAQRERNAIFYLDGLNYSIRMGILARNRLIQTLDEIACRRSLDQQCEEQAVSALLDVWTIIDMCHRARTLVQQAPELPKRSPEVQVFVRSTATAERLRNYVQHFSSGIPNIPQATNPLWGAISWIPSHDLQTCYTMFTGSMQTGVTTETISYDTFTRRFTKQAILVAGNEEVDLFALANHLANLKTFLNGLRLSGMKSQSLEGGAFIWKVSMPDTLGSEKHGSGEQ